MKLFPTAIKISQSKKARALVLNLSAEPSTKILENGRLKETNFDAYKWQRNQDLPELDIHIVENGVHPSGSGENTLSLVAPAVCNAIQMLTGKRLRSLPLKHHLPIV